MKKDKFNSIKILIKVFLSVIVVFTLLLLLLGYVFVNYDSFIIKRQDKRDFGTSFPYTLIQDKMPSSDVGLGLLVRDVSNDTMQQIIESVSDEKFLENRREDIISNHNIYTLWNDETLDDAVIERVQNQAFFNEEYTTKFKDLLSTQGVLKSATESFYVTKGGTRNTNGDYTPTQDNAYTLIIYAIDEQENRIYRYIVYGLVKEKK